MLCIFFYLAENVPKVEPGLPNGAEAPAPPAAAPQPAAPAPAAPSVPIKTEPSLELGTQPALKLDQVCLILLYIL